MTEEEDHKFNNAGNMLAKKEKCMSNIGVTLYKAFGNSLESRRPYEGKSKKDNPVVVEPMCSVENTYAKCGPAGTFVGDVCLSRAFATEARYYRMNNPVKR